MVAGIHAQKDEWHRWMAEIPFIEFPVGWKIKMVPPFGGAVVRFKVILPGVADVDVVSVYLDCYSRLAMRRDPYWEVYPYKSDVGRCEMNEIDKLLEMIADRSKE